MGWADGATTRVHPATEPDVAARCRRVVRIRDGRVASDEPRAPAATQAAPA